MCHQHAKGPTSRPHHCKKEGNNINQRWDSQISILTEEKKSVGLGSRGNAPGGGQGVLPPEAEDFS